LPEAAVDPVRVEAQRDVLGVGAEHHVVELRAALRELDVVVVVGQRQAELVDLGPKVL